MDTDSYIEEIKNNIDECNIAMFGIDSSMMAQQDFENLTKMAINYKKLSEDEITDLSIRLTQHIYAVQYRVNKSAALISYLQDLIRTTIAKDIPQYKGVSWDYAEALAIENNDYAKDLHRRVREYKLVFMGCKDQITILKDLAKKVEGLKYAKKF